MCVGVLGWAASEPCSRSQRGFGTTTKELASLQSCGLTSSEKSVLLLFLLLLDLNHCLYIHEHAYKDKKVEMASLNVKTVLYTDINSWELKNSIEVAVCFVFSVLHLDAQASCHRNCTSSIVQACSSQYAFMSLPSVCRRTVMLDKMQHHSMWQHIFFQCIAVWSAFITHTLVWQL